MNDLYQLRKDVDGLILEIQRIGLQFDNTVTESDIDDFTKSLSLLENNLDNFHSNLLNYKNKLLEFDGQLNGENGFYSQLLTFQEQLNGENGFASRLDAFNQQLNGTNGFSSRLDAFNQQLNGTNGFARRLGDLNDQINGNSGFYTALTNVQFWIYGEGSTYTDDNNVVHNCTYSDPCPSSLKGMLNYLNGQLSNLQAGDRKLLLDLNMLKENLTGFTGTLQEFKDELDENPNIDTSAIDDGLLKLFYAINTTIDTVEGHETEVQKFDGWLGDPSDSASTQGNSPTMFGVLNDTSSAVGDQNSGLIKEMNTTNVILNGDPNNNNDTGLRGLASDMNVTLNGDPSDDDDTGLVGLTGQLNVTVNGDPSDDDDTGLSGLTHDINITVNGDNQHNGLVETTGNIITTLEGDDENVGLIDMTEGVIETVGEPSVNNQPSTGLFSVIDGVDGKTESIKNKIGYNLIGNTSLQSQIITQNGKIGAVPTGKNLYTLFSELGGEYSQTKTAVGDLVDTTLPSLEGQLDTLGEFTTALSYSLLQILKPSSEYTEIYYCSGVPSTQDLLIWEADYGYDTSNINYAVNQTGTEYVRSGSSWSTGTIPSSITKKIGVIGFFDERPQEGFNPTFDYIYSVSTKEYFKLSQQ